MKRSEQRLCVLGREVGEFILFSSLSGMEIIESRPKDAEGTACPAPYLYKKE